MPELTLQQSEGGLGILQRPLVEAQQLLCVESTPPLGEAAHRRQQTLERRAQRLDAPQSTQQRQGERHDVRVAWLLIQQLADHVELLLGRRVALDEPLVPAPEPALTRNSRCASGPLLTQLEAALEVPCGGEVLEQQLVDGRALDAGLARAAKRCHRRVELIQLALKPRQPQGQCAAPLGAQGWGSQALFEQGDPALLAPALLHQSEVAVQRVIGVRVERHQTA